MTTLIDLDDGWVQCCECDMVFMVVWNRAPDIDRIQVCPFCGEEVEV